MNVNIWTWPQLTLAPGATVSFVHSVTGPDGSSAIDPDHWYWMSAVPDYDPQQRPDGPSAATGIEIVSQYAFRDYEYPAGPDNAVWIATWKAPSGPEESITYFRPKMLVAPSE